MKMLCDIYKSSVEPDMYLYVRQEDGLTRVPDTLLARFGKPAHAMTIVLQPQRKLARADIAVVLDSLATQGFYLQLSSSREDYMQTINTHNTKLNGRR
ncbi:YcgL domain-containing protein [Exilibacterium tricleocarpae]|uniref:YcgL domain-containing protein FKG94_26665 n=1 Tax=Exilibacterium tricleocarpae TaxID=2591008 RepID=A0A545SPN8_9GAMM|nr:YcgL domain-containing protein [Exilibacterium tricleocarpae]TQV66939.1 YcgL domain-containing protein [Exilibacterium tricleocarpae]